MKAHSFVLGISLALFGLAALLLVSRIPYTPLSDNGDPGPRLLPGILGVFLLAGGLAESGLAWLSPARLRPPANPPAREKTRPWALLSWVCALVLYVALIPWLGYAPATFCLIMGLLAWQGLRWWVAAAIAAGMVAVVFLLFSVAFKVPLPGGWLLGG